MDNLLLQPLVFFFYNNQVLISPKILKLTMCPQQTNQGKPHVRIHFHFSLFGVIFSVIFLIDPFIFTTTTNKTILSFILVEYYKILYHNEHRFCGA